MGIRSAATALALMMLATACGGGGGGSDEAITPAGEVERCTAAEGTITMGTYSPPPGLDPKVMSGGVIGGGVETAAIFDRLMRYDPETGGFEPRVAESLEPDDDYRTWTLKLRPDVRFGNGDLLDAAAVKYSIERLKAADNATQSRYAVAPITAVEVVDDRTVQIHLDARWPGFPATLADEGGMVVNPRVVEALGPEEFRRNPRGGGVGAFEVERFAPGEELVLSAKAEYWDGVACAQELRFVAIPQPQAAYEAFSTGELDLTLVRDARVLAEAEDAGVEAFVNYQNSGHDLIMNQNDPVRPTADRRIRQAVAYALDQAAIDQRVTEGNSITARGVIGVEAGPFVPTDGLPIDVERARGLVAEARASGFSGRVSLICSNDRVDQTLAVAAQLQAAGFDVVTDTTLTVSQLIERVRVTKDYDVACWGSNFDASTTWQRLVASIGPGASTGYRSQDMDAALAMLQEAATTDEYRSAMTKVQEVWNTDVPIVPLVVMPEAILMQPDMKGVLYTSKTVPLLHAARTN